MEVVISSITICGNLLKAHLFWSMAGSQSRMVTDMKATHSRAVVIKALATTSEATLALCIHYHHEELTKFRRIKPGLKRMILSDFG